ncbi:U2 snRNP-associated SURP motif-containing protein [Cydia fagiglandana]|uniref:U2 snRNP-associated SURP motif-containing protein n=1 Tax=Cydia fagiglandana TaxID=1458189 RepID=UPI002FEE2D5B
MKKIPEQKLQAFSAGSMGARNLSKKELEELRKKEEEEAAAHVFKEFVETFQEAPSTTSKVWVKAGTYDAGARKEDTSERGKLYKPTSRFEDKRPSAEDVVRSLAQRSTEQTRLRAKQSKDKKKSNLELFKEELRMIQEERSERHKYKNVLRERGAPVGAEPASLELLPDVGSYDTGDPNTTNLYLGNLNPKITEQQLMEIFGRYGPLASIKIMWPRSDEEKARGRNCGFVAFMSRRDGERALRCINGKEIMSYEMKLGWGKAVVIPPVPIYIPPSLQTPCQPPPPSGLPFNAQPPKHRANKIPRVRPGEYYPSDPEDRQAYEEILSQSIVKVVIPTERNILMLIHRMVEFVIREGPMFEAIIMNKEMNNPFFRFLFENQSPAHVYYRWKLFSMLQGDSPKQWANNDFRMFKGGSVWRPPVMNLYTAGMPDELVDEDESKENIRGTLSNNQRDRLEELIRGLTPNRTAIGEAMAWCLEHAEAAGEVTQCLAESLAGETTAPHKRVARLYLLSDILHNAQAKLTNASAFRSAIQSRLLDIMRDCHVAWLRMSSRLQQEGFRARVTRILQAWADWAVYPADLLLAASDAFRGRTDTDKVRHTLPRGVAAHELAAAAGRAWADWAVYPADLLLAASDAFRGRTDTDKQEGFRARVTRILQAWADWAVYPADLLLAASDAFRGRTDTDKQEGFRARVTRILQAWADWAVYPADLLLAASDAFRGRTDTDKQEGFRARVTRILQAWADWAVYPADLLLAASDAFRGRTDTDKQEGFRARVTRILQAWADWAVYPADLLLAASDAFRGRTDTDKQEGFRARVTRILQAWADWAVYPADLLLAASDAFRGRTDTDKGSEHASLAYCRPGPTGPCTPPTCCWRPATPSADGPTRTRYVTHCHVAWLRMSSRLQQDGFRARVTRILQAWADWAVYPADLLLAASDAFRGRTDTDKAELENIDGVSDPGSGGSSPASGGSWAGGGAGPLDGAALRRLAAGRQPPVNDIDGVPVEEEEDIDGIPLEVEKSRPVGGFIPSKWESVEPTDSWPEPAQPPPPPSITPTPQLDTYVVKDFLYKLPTTTSTTANTSMSEELSLKRSVLRDIEVKVLKYADELEAGHRARRPGLTPQQQLQHYRRKLIKKASREAKEAVEESLELPSPRRRLSPEDDTYSTSSKKSKKSRDASLSPPVKRSRHSERKSRSRSRDRERSGERREREREREHRRRRSPATPPAHHHRKHAKHSKYKY